MIKTIIQLSEAKSKKEIEQILINSFMNKEFDLFKAFRYAANPYFLYNIQKVALIEEDDGFSGSLTFTVFETLIKNILSNKLSEIEIKKTINSYAMISHVPTWNLIYRKILLKQSLVDTHILNKILKRVESAYSEANDFLIPKFDFQKPQLDFQPTGRKLIDLNISGQRIISIINKEYNFVLLLNTNGKEYVNSNIKNCLMKIIPYIPCSIVLDGCITNGTYIDIIENRTNNKEFYSLFDLILLKDFEKNTSSMSQAKRHDFLYQLDKEGLLKHISNNLIYVLPKAEIDFDIDKDKFEELLKLYKNVIIKDSNAFYNVKKNKNWIQKTLD